MKPKLLLFFGIIPLLLCHLNVLAQSEVHDIQRDTIVLKEFTISATLPINDRQVEKFYSTNYFSTIDNLASRLEGLSMIKRGAYAMEPQLNGFSGGQLNMTIDGMKMFGACTDKMDPITSYIEPTNLKSITIHHGTKGCMNGCNIGGSVDMALSEPACSCKEKLFTSAGLGYESVSNGRNALFSTSYAKNKWQWGLNGVYRKNDLYTNGNGDRVPFSQFEKSNLHSVLKYSADSIRTLRADILYDLALNVGYPALPMDVGRARAVLFALEYRNIKSHNLKAKVYYNSIYHLMDDSKRDSVYYVTNKSTGQREMVYMRMDMPGKSQTFGAYLQEEFSLNNKNRLLIKADNYANHSLAEMTMHMHYAGKPPESPMYLQTWPEMIRNVTGIYAQNSTFLTGSSTLSISGRMEYTLDLLQSHLARDQFSVFNINVADNYQNLTKGIDGSFQYRFKKPFVIEAEAGWSERMPTIGERFGFYLYNAYDGYDYIGNPDLETEKSLFGRISLMYSNPKLKIKLSPSYNQISDYIMGITNEDIPPMNFYTNGTRVYTNVAEAKLYSVDLQAIFIPIDRISVFVLTKYTHGQLNSGEPMPLIPPLKNILSVSYERDNWSIQAENEAAFKQERININYGESVTPSYTIFNVKGNHQFRLKDNEFDCSLGITNIMDTAYYEHLDWGKILRPGRSFNFFLKYSF